MKTVKIVRMDEVIPCPYTNPFPINTIKEFAIVGSVTWVATGLKIVLPNDCRLEFIPSEKTAVVGYTICDEQLYIGISMVIGSYKIFKVGELIAQVSIMKSESEQVRFVDMTDGKRIVFSEGKEVGSCEVIQS